MATGTLAPAIYQTVFDLNGDPVSFAKVYTYIAGTTTPAPTYTEVTLTVASANPIITNAAGQWKAFLVPGSSYKFIFQTADGVAIGLPADNVSAIPTSSSNLDITGVAGEAITFGEPIYLSDGSGGKIAGSWYGADAANTYSSTLPQVGIALANVASGLTFALRMSGRMEGLSSLVVGTTYYIASGGGMTSTPPTNSRILGQADTTATLIMFPALPALVVPRCRLYLNTTQSVSDSTITALNWDSETYDVGTLHSTSANTSRIVIPTSQDGTYRFDASIAFASNATGYRGVYLRKNGTTSISATFLSAVNGTATILPIAAQVVLVATDYVEVLAFHTAGAPLLIGSGADDIHWFSAVRVA